VFELYSKSYSGVLNLSCIIF